MKRKTILLVDDSNTILMMEKFILAKGGYDLITAMNGEEAVVKAQSARPDLILMDVIMPKMSGFEACHRLREIEETKRTPIIMVTTRGEAANVEAGWSNGCTDYVTKPINAVELLAKVQNLLTANVAETASLESEKKRLELEMVQVRAEADHRQQIERELDRLHEQIREIEEENRRFAVQYEDVERQSSNLANLYVASYRLHSTVERPDVLDGIQEIVINLIGSEELAIFERDRSSNAFVLVRSFGILESKWKKVPANAGSIGATLVSGETFVAPEGAGDDCLTACIPLKIGGEVIGAVAIFRLLSHKPALEPVDFELFELLGAHASTAFYCSGLHSQQQAVR